MGVGWPSGGGCVEVSLAGGPRQGGYVSVEVAVAVAVAVTVAVVAGVVEEVFVGDVGGPGEGVGHLWWMVIEMMEGIERNGKKLASLRMGGCGRCFWSNS